MGCIFLTKIPVLLLCGYSHFTGRWNVPGQV